MKASHRSQRQFLLLFLFIGSGLGIQPASAQFTANFQTNTISGVTSNWAGNYFVGSNTFANALLIRNAGILSNTDGYMGYQSGSSNNYVMVTGAGSVWSNASDLYLGYAGAGNTLIISNAARVANGSGAHLGYTSTSSSNNVLVTGNNSVWESGGLTLGSSSVGNSLVISNGGRVVVNTDCLMGSIGSSYNSALITGAGSVWSNNGNYLNIGYFGKNNKMTISNGGHVYCSNYGMIGSTDSSSNNTVWIADSGSLWDVSAVAMELAVGWSGAGNSLIITNGGQLKGYYVYIGRNSSNNTALVTGSGSTWTLNCYTYVGYKGNSNTMTLANGAKAVDKFIYINHEIGSSNNSVVVTGTNTTWQNSDNVFVGLNGSRGGLTISNGAWVTNLFGVLGFYATSSSNNAVVTGGGAGWHCVEDMVVGQDGWGNNLAIRDGGRVRGDYGHLGYNPGSSNNSVWVSGAGAVWTNNSDLYVGRSGGGNSLVISNGGRVADFAGILGMEAESSGNKAVITGAGAVWTNAASAFVGYDGANNSLVISNGGEVVGRWGIVGENASSTNNTVRVESGGIWRNRILVVGDEGSHNALFVDGGSVFATNMVVGFNTPYCDNLVQLDNGLIAVTNQTHDAVLEVYRGSLALFGGTLTVDKLIVTNHCAQFFHAGGTLIYRSLQLDPAFDPDADGIPNGWEQANGLDPLDPFDAEADNDGDGMSNLQEYMAGTNPTNSASSLRITSQVLAGSNIRVSWNAVGGKSYIVQKSSAPGAGFTDLSPVISVPGVGETVTNYLHVGAATSWPTCYYRVRLAQ